MQAINFIKINIQLLNNIDHYGNMPFILQIS